MQLIGLPWTKRIRVHMVITAHVSLTYRRGQHNLKRSREIRTFEASRVGNFVDILEVPHQVTLS